MKTYTVEITETLIKLVRVNAADEAEALSQVETMYNKGEVILDALDLFDTSFDIHHP